MALGSVRFLDDVQGAPMAAHPGFRGILPSSVSRGVFGKLAKRFISHQNTSTELCGWVSHLLPFVRGSYLMFVSFPMPMTSRFH